MTKEEYKTLKDFQKDNSINIYELNDRSDRTVLYGYDLERNTIHLYIKNNQFHYVKYNSGGKTIVYINYEDLIPDLYRIIPDKRTYPAASDFEFCNILKQKGKDICFTNYEETPYETFYGLIKP